jgi:twinfilin-like protein
MVSRYSKSHSFSLTFTYPESLVHDLSIEIKGSLQEDLQTLQDEDVLPKDFSAYVLAKLDAPSPDWMILLYVPDNAKVRDKVRFYISMMMSTGGDFKQMLYASTRLSLLKSLGSSLFTDSIFATSKADLTPEAYDAHLRHVSAPNLLSAREQEIADMREAENEAVLYTGSKVRATHLESGVGLNWSPEVEHAITKLGEGTGCSIVIIVSYPNLLSFPKFLIYICVRT